MKDNVDAGNQLYLTKSALIEEAAMFSGWLGVITVRASHLQSSSCGFDSRSGCYQAM